VYLTVITPITDYNITLVELLTKSLEISKGYSETVIQRKYNDLQKRDKKTYNGQ
jgi:hypothetical protein